MLTWLLALNDALTRAFAIGDRAVLWTIEAIDRHTAPRAIWNGTPIHLRGRPLPPAPDTRSWGCWYVLR